MKILSFGEIIWDVFDDAACIGGAPFNFAAHAARQGAESYLLSAVGNDELGRAALKKVQDYGIRADHISTVNKPTGYCRVTLDKNGIPSYKIGEDVAYDAISADIAAMKRFDALSFGTLALRGEHNRKVLTELMQKMSFGEIYCDVNIRPPFYSDESILFCLENATVLKISDEELATVEEAVFGDISERCESAAGRLSERFKNLKAVIITLGSKGSFALDCISGEEFSHPASRAEVVSTVGAGDSFGAAFLVAYMSGESLPTCLKKASDLSAYVVSHTEAVPE